MLRALCAIVVAAAAVALAASPAYELQQLFGGPASDVALPARAWLGGDSDWSIDLGNGSSIWLFADTFVGAWDAAADLRVGPGMAMPHGTLARVDRSPLSSTFFWNTTAEGEPIAWFQVESTTGDYVWTTAGKATHEGGRTGLLLSSIRVRTEGKGAFGFMQVATTVFTVPNAEGHPSTWEYTSCDIPGTGNTTGLYWHTGMWEDPADASRVYVLGQRQRVAGRVAAGAPEANVLMRLPASSFGACSFVGAELWAGGEWVQHTGSAPPEPSTLTPVFPYAPGTSETSVTARPACAGGGLFSLYIPFDSPTVRVYVSESSDPTGPWVEDESMAFELPAPSNDTRDFFSYAGKAHPELDTVGSGGSCSSVVSVVTNSFSIGKLFEPGNGQVYRPQLWRLHWTAQGASPKAEEKEEEEEEAAAGVSGEGMASTTALLQLPAALEHHGFGGLSAGASSRLLWDYEPEVRDEILDLLFKPQYGAGLTINKVEIGGSVASTDGAEAVIEPTGRGSLDCRRIQYEGWLISEAERRNPAVRHYGLSWGVPAWVGNESFWSQDNINLHMDWMNCVKNLTGVSVDYLGGWNEKVLGPQGKEWAVQLRKALDEGGFPDTKIILPDGWLEEQFLDALATNKTLRNAVWGLGLHYPCHEQAPKAIEIGLPYWASEDYSSDAAAWATGGDVWGRLLVQNFVELNVTATIAWSTVWSVYPNLVCQHNGLTRAMEPWSGHFDVDTPLFASAHLGQFVQPGWWYLGVGDGAGSGWMSANGSYVTLVDQKEAATEFVVLAATLSQGKCVLRNVTSPQTLTVTLAKGFPRPAAGGAALWRTTETELFAMIQDGIKATERPDGTATITITVEPDALYTLASHPKGQTMPRVSPPPSRPFPLPYSDNFTVPGAPDTGYNLTARYWADMYGLFEMRPLPGREGGFIRQQIMQTPGHNGWWATNPAPLTIAGDANWTDVEVTALAFLNTTGPSPPPRRLCSAREALDVCDGPELSRGLSRTNRGRACRDCLNEEEAALPTRYVETCGRIGTLQGFKGWKMAYCARFNASSWWLVRGTNSGETVMAAGALPAGAWEPSEGGGFLQIGLRVNGSTVTPLVASKALQDVTDPTPLAQGLVGLGCGWHDAAFGTTSVVPV